MVRDSVSVDEGSSLVLKGKRLPVTPTGRSTSPRSASGRTERIPLVGRVDEIRRMREAFDLAVSQRACRLLTVTGTAGAGKSRLASEFVTGIEGEAVTIEGRCLPYGDGITFWPIAEAVRELAGIDLDDPLEIARSKLALLRGAEDSGLLFDRVAAAIGLADTTVGMQETFWAIRRLLEQVAREHPLVVTWTTCNGPNPRSSILEYLLRSCRDAPTRPLPRLERSAGGTIRMGDPPAERDDPSPAAAGSGGDRDADDELFEGGDLSAALRGRISDVGSGNPLFVVEMFKMLRDDGVLEAQGADAGGSTRKPRSPRSRRRSMPSSALVWTGSRRRSEPRSTAAPHRQDLLVGSRRRSGPR